MNKADKPSGKSSVKKQAGLKTGQAKVDRPGLATKKKEVVTSPAPGVKKIAPRSAAVIKIQAKSARATTAKAPDLNQSGYPLHPTRIWPD